MSDDARTLRIRCRTWDQVETFYTEKLRGTTLVVKMPIRPALSETVTVALGLPDGLVFAIDGVVAKVSEQQVNGKHPVALRLLGLTAEVRGQLERLVHGGRKAAATQTAPAAPAPRPTGRADLEAVAAVPPPVLDDVVTEEREIFLALEEERERLSRLPAHEVLGVASDADLPAIRSGYFALTRRFHPDAYGRCKSPAVRELASEVFLHINRAYDRLRGTFSKEERAGAPALGARDGWLVGADLGRGSDTLQDAPADDNAYASVQVIHAPAVEGTGDTDEIAFTTSVRMKALTADELFSGEGEGEAPAAEAPVPERPVPPVRPEAQAPKRPLAQTSFVDEGRAALAAGQPREACERFAAALRVDPRNRVVRALYHVANGLDLRARGDGARATEQFETALKHDPQCEEARRALAPPEKDRPGRSGIFKKLFDR